VAIKVDDCYMGNADFLLLLAQIITDTKKKIEYKIVPNFFDEIILWNATKKDKYIEYTLDYESDRPSYSKNYLTDIDYATENSATIALNPKNLNMICVDNFCTLPEDYMIKKYTSMQVAWPTAIMKNNTIYKPKCYPFCSVQKATPILLNEFIDKYGIPLTWHMTGDSIIALAQNKSLIKQVLSANRGGLLSLGMQTMYHSNIKEISKEDLENSMEQNYNIFHHFFKKNPVQFRAPYQQLPMNYSASFLKNYNIIADNEGDHACRECTNGNYEKYEDADVLYVKIDSEIAENDKLINFYPYHPWELIFTEQGSPTYLVESNEKKAEIITQWLFFIGEFGFTPVSVETYLSK
jgi:hypothetical protein